MGGAPDSPWSPGGLLGKGVKPLTASSATDAPCGFGVPTFGQLTLLTLKCSLTGQGGGRAHERRFCGVHVSVPILQTGLQGSERDTPRVTKLLSKGRNWESDPGLRRRHCGCSRSVPSRGLSVLYL